MVKHEKVRSTIHDAGQRLISARAVSVGCTETAYGELSMGGCCMKDVLGVVYRCLLADTETAYGELSMGGCYMKDVLGVVYRWLLADRDAYGKLSMGGCYMKDVLGVVYRCLLTVQRRRMASCLWVAVT
ncbi:hypothetical protein J6590_085675 [Homalodisca vitripennis]|nr:hypothetical protein J6590_085675 [Homalodisca vitripennis]